MKPLLQATGDSSWRMLPDDPEGLLNKLKKAKPGASEEAVPDSDTEGKLSPTGPTATPAPAPAAPAAPGAAPAPAPNSPT